MDHQTLLGDTGQHRVGALAPMEHVPQATEETSPTILPMDLSLLGLDDLTDDDASVDDEDLVDPVKEPLVAPQIERLRSSPGDSTTVMMYVFGAMGLGLWLQLLWSWLSAPY